MRRSGQMGVPVIALDGQTVVGFDQPRLEQLLAAALQEFRLGAAVAVRSGGLYVGRVRPGSAGDRAGLQTGDTITALNGQPPTDPAAFERRLQTLSKLTDWLTVTVNRNGSRVDLNIAARRVSE